MILGMMSKSIAVLDQATIATNATASVGPFDLQGCGAAIIEAIHNPAVATNSSAKWAVLAVYVGDSTAFTSATAVSGLSGTTASTASTSQFVLGVHNDTTYASVTRLAINQLRHRYVFITRQVPGATNYNAPGFIVHGYHAAQAPSSASEAGVAAWASAADTA